MSEVGRLANLSSLRDLDLRLNPIMAAAAAFGGEGGRGLSGSMSAVGGGGGGSRSDSDRRADVLRVLPQLTSLNSRRVVDDERLPRRNQRYEQQRRGGRAEAPPLQRGTRQHHPGHKPHQRERQQRPQASVVAPSAKEKPSRDGANDEDSAAWDTGLGLGMPGGNGRGRRERADFSSEAAAATAASGLHRHLEQPLSRRTPRPRRGGVDDHEVEEDEFARFFPAAGEAPRAPPPPSNHGRGRVAVAAEGGDTSPRVLRSSVSPRSRDGGAARTFERFVDGGGCGVAPDEDRGRDGYRYRQPGVVDHALETEKEGTAVAAVRRKRDRPGVGDVGRRICSPDGGAVVAELRREGRRSDALGDGSGRARVVGGCARDPRGPFAGVGGAAAAVFNGGHVDLDGRAITPPQAVSLAPPTAGEGGNGDDLATLWLELGTNESLDSSRQPSLPSSLSASVAAAVTTTTTTVSAAAKAVQAFRRSTQRLGLPATVPADGDHGGDNGNARDDRDADSHWGASCPEDVSSALGELSLATTPAGNTSRALATTTLVKAAAPSEGAAVPNPKPGSECPDDGIAQRCTACGGSGACFDRRPDRSATAARKSEAAATAEVVAAAGRVFSSACDAREMDERWWAREREFTERWAAREREFDARWAARDRELDKRRREESKVGRPSHSECLQSVRTYFVPSRTEVDVTGTFLNHLCSSHLKRSFTFCEPSHFRLYAR